MEDITVIMYHYVRKREHGLFSGLKVRDTDEFIREIEYIKKTYNPIKIEDLIAYVYHSEKLPKKSCLLTFDDGYIDHFINVVPILRKFNIQGSFYPTVIGASRDKLLSVNKIQILLSEIGYDNLKILIKEIEKLYNEADFNKIPFISLYNSCPTHPMYSKDELFIKTLLQYKLPFDIRNNIIDALFKQFIKIDEEAISEIFYASSDMLSCMVDLGMHVGAHGSKHIWLDKENRESQEKEIEESLSMLKKIYRNDKFLWSMAYPFGGYNIDTLNLLKEKGCSLAFTTKDSLYNKANFGKYEIPRIDTNIIFSRCS